MKYSRYDSQVRPFVQKLHSLIAMVFSQFTKAFSQFILAFSQFMQVSVQFVMALIDPELLWLSFQHTDALLTLSKFLQYF